MSSADLRAVAMLAGAQSGNTCCIEFHHALSYQLKGQLIKQQHRSAQVISSNQENAVSECVLMLPMGWHGRLFKCAWCVHIHVQSYHQALLHAWACVLHAAALDDSSVHDCVHSMHI